MYRVEIIENKYGDLEDYKNRINDFFSECANKEYEIKDIKTPSQSITMIFYIYNPIRNLDISEESVEEVSRKARAIGAFRSYIKREDSLIEK